jgi:alpha-L-rhamnosidase
VCDFNIFMKQITLVVWMLGLFPTVFAQSRPFVSKPSQLDDAHYAEWITAAEKNGVFYYRKTFTIHTIPDSFIVHVSADARYRLYVNGKQASWGPAAGDIENWNYETVDIARFLVPGVNIISSQVWNWGELNGARQQTVRSAFILQGNTTAEQIINTNKTWKVSRDNGYFALPMDSETVGGGYIAGSTDSINGKMHPWDWNLIDFDDSAWRFAEEYGKGNHTGLDTWIGTAWKLKQRELPAMEQVKERTLGILDIKGIKNPDINNMNFYIPTNSHVEVLLDNRTLTVGFLQILVSVGENSKIKVQYQESLFNSDGTKGNRNEWKGKLMKGYYDIFIPDGGDRLFEPLWIRTFRYIKLTIETKDEPLHIKDIFNLYTTYPLQQKATFETTNSDLKNIWDVSWRTQRLCALETFMDCPYYEQLQYIGDSRIQALITMYVSGDERLARNAIQQIYNSMQPMGLTKSVHPSGNVQIIPPFSLLYIAMIHDYFMMRDDSRFARQFMPGIQFILEWFISRIDTNGILGPLPYWNHIDGGTDFTNGSPPGISEGGSAHMTLLLAYALDQASVMLDSFENSCVAERYRRISSDLKKSTMDLCYSAEKKLIAETPEKKQFSQHTNIFAILTDAFCPTDQKEVIRIILSDKSLIQTTLYFKFYLFQAMKKAGMGDMVPDLMNEWTAFLSEGLTTFPEHGLNSRSDCHAWSAHPLYHFINTIAGISPASAGFKSVEIIPALGYLHELKCTMPHPLGEISVQYRKNLDNELNCKVILPVSLYGTFVYYGKTFHLHGGMNSFVVKKD